MHWVLVDVVVESSGNADKGLGCSKVVDGDY